MKNADRLDRIKARMYSRQYDEHHTREQTEKSKTMRLIYEANYAQSMSRRAWR